MVTQRVKRYRADVTPYNTQSLVRKPVQRHRAILSRHSDSTAPQSYFVTPQRYCHAMQDLVSGQEARRVPQSYFVTPQCYCHAIQDLVSGHEARRTPWSQCHVIQDLVCGHNARKVIQRWQHALGTQVLVTRHDIICYRSFKVNNLGNTHFKCCHA